ncbi:MAG: T9SS type A sorting domain-containing protein, partial [Bacteroidetes bacterium]|nr:T9SS type A sorting domain-containing protein [Bacteroidota bacterium]
EVYTYNIELPYGTSTVPTTTASTNYASANYVVNEATSLPGTTNVIVTAEDGITEKTYSVSFAIEKPSNDATLSDLKTNDITVPEFAPEVYTYNVELLSGTSTVPKTTASTNYTNASYVVNEATSLPGTTNVVVTAEDDLTEKTYSINFTFKTGIYSENHAKNSDISIYPNPATSIINLKINTDLFFSIMIFDTKGTCLYHKTDINAYKGFVKKINIKNFNKGIYYFKIITTDNTIVKKLVIE